MLSLNKLKLLPFQDKGKEYAPCKENTRHGRLKHAKFSNQTHIWFTKARFLKGNYSSIGHRLVVYQQLQIGFKVMKISKVRPT